MFLNTFSPTRSPNPEAGSWVVAPHQGRPFGTAKNDPVQPPKTASRSYGLTKSLNAQLPYNAVIGPLEPVRALRARAACAERAFFARSDG